MQMKCESDKKEKELFEENKAANLRMQSKHEDFTKLSVNFEHVRGKSQSLEAERDKLLQDIEKMSQSEATLQKEFQVQSEEIQTRQVKCGCTWCKNQKTYSFQELVLKHESTIKNLEVQLHDETLLHQSIVKHHSEEIQAYSKSFAVHSNLNWPIDRRKIQKLKRFPPKLTISQNCWNKRIKKTKV